MAAQPDLIAIIRAIVDEAPPLPERVARIVSSIAPVGGDASGTAA